MVSDLEQDPEYADLRRDMPGMFKFMAVHHLADLCRKRMLPGQLA
jgi:hypothetical protein